MKTEQIGLGLSVRNRRFRANEANLNKGFYNKIHPAGYFVNFTMKYVERVPLSHGTDAL